MKEQLINELRTMSCILKHEIKHIDSKQRSNDLFLQMPFDYRSNTKNICYTMAEGDCHNCPAMEDLPTSPTSGRADEENLETETRNARAKISQAKAHLTAVWRLLNETLDMTQAYTDARHRINDSRGRLREINTQLGSDLRRMLEKGRTEGWTRSELIAAEVRIWEEYEGLVEAMTKAPEEVQRLLNRDQRKAGDDNTTDDDATGDDYDESITPPSGLGPDDQSSTEEKSVKVCARDE